MRRSHGSGALAEELKAEAAEPRTIPVYKEVEEQKRLLREIMSRLEAANRTVDRILLLQNRRLSGRQRRRRT